MRCLFSVFLVATVSLCVAGLSTADRKHTIIGSWIVETNQRPSRIVTFHADGTWGVRNFDPTKREEINERRWSIEDNKLVLTYAHDHGMETWDYKIVWFDRDRFVTQTDGYRSTYTRTK